MKKSNDRLQCFVDEDGLLQISIGIDTLSFCALEKNGGIIKDIETYGSIDYKTEIINNKHFADHIIQTMKSDDELGNSLLTDFFDKCIVKSLHNGNHGMKYTKIKSHKH